MSVSQFFVDRFWRPGQDQIVVSFCFYPCKDLKCFQGLKDMRISHRGKILKATDRLPPDGAHIFVSGSTPKQEAMEVEFPVVTQEEMNKAKNLIKTYGSSRNPIRHEFNTLASEMMKSVFKNYPNFARKDPIGAKICVSAGNS